MKLTGDSRLKREINRVDKQKSLNKKKKKVVEKKKMIDTECEDNINTVTDKASKRINHWQIVRRVREQNLDKYESHIQVFEDSEQLIMNF